MRGSLKKIYIFLVIILALLLSTGCNNPVGTPAAAAQGPGPHDSEKITVHGLKDSDFEITPADLKKLKAVTVHAEATRSNGENIKLNATGPLLDTFLEKYGKTQKDFTAIRFEAKDNYSIAVPPDILGNRQIVIAYANNGKPLADADQPVQIVIPGERAMYWVRMLRKIDFETGETAQACTKVVFLETLAKGLPQEDYKYYDSTDKAIKTGDLIGKCSDVDDGSVKSVFMTAGDGLKKNETKENFLNAFIKITGADSPKFLAPQFPQGMHVRDLMYINYGTTAIFSVEEGKKVLPGKMDGKIKGIAFSDIAKQVGMSSANTYRFTGTGGTFAELEISELARALVYQENDGTLTFSSGSKDSESIKDLVSIEPVK